jgi:hypothetical protein
LHRYATGGRLISLKSPGVVFSSLFYCVLFLCIFMHCLYPTKKKIYEQTIPSDSTQSHGKRLMIHKLVAEGTARPGSVQKSFRPLWAIAKKKAAIFVLTLNVVYYIITQGNKLPSISFVPFPFVFPRNEWNLFKEFELLSSNRRWR